MITKKWSGRKAGLSMLASVLLVTLLFAMVPVSPVLAQNSPPVAVNDFYTMNEEALHY